MKKRHSKKHLLFLIEQIKQEGETTALPSCLGDCDECEYRNDYWKELLSSRGIRVEGDGLYYL